MTDQTRSTRRRPRRPAFLATGVALAAVVVLAGACSGGGRASTTSRAPKGGAPTSTWRTAAGNGAPVDLTATKVRLTDIGADLDHPIDMAFRPGSTSSIVAERGGRIVELVRDGDGYRPATGPVIDLTARVGDTAVERGLLGIAVSPDGSHLYASYTEATHGDSRIDEYALGGSDGSLRADAASRRQLLAIEQPFPNHNGGSLRFGTDKMLYAGFGDGGGAGDPNGNGQSPDTLLGKVLRLDPTGVHDRDHDGIPDDNPFVTPRTDGRRPAAFSARPEIWLTGVRNPWRIDIDPRTGDLWIGDVGENRFEEIDHLAPEGATGAGFGANLGWNLFEGTARFDGAKPAPGAASAGPFVMPVLTYSHDRGCAITGGVVVRDERLPGLAGAYLYGDFCAPGVRAMRDGVGGAVQQADLGLDIRSVVSFARGPDGRVYVISLDGRVARIDPA